MGPLQPLTRREVEVLNLLAGNYANREIASALNLAEDTVKTLCPASCSNPIHETEHAL